MIMKNQIIISPRFHSMMENRIDGTDDDIRCFSNNEGEIIFVCLILFTYV